jgi:hypothetical protein
MKKILIGVLIAIISITAIVMIKIYTAKPEKYTAVIIDCSNMGLTRGMAPKVLDTTGKEIYPGAAASGMNMKEVVESGVVTYESSLDKARSHILAGSNPIIIKAKSLDGIIKSDPVIADSDAVELANADNTGKFLVERKVIFVQ